MNQYFACLLFESSINDGHDTSSLKEESIRLIIADNRECALEKAKKIGKSAEHEYTNKEGSLVSWEFVSIVDIQQFCEDSFSDGVEVYSRMNWKD